ncbi:CAMK/CAMK1 protein kinase [Thecamonas trahens ATCC 50062]|uniref:CAMK/CAMK1 protein kinase n=1 Tax=Thecamonas trahens ATCC 50062 TaxID=461836 RepID=A0A0L0D9Y8_THETB|nr:CAMK/CAMK1 protein kinase [Thecamonas trahens ATCC 50062]KNC48088.1 CAMK/CAMK1 protein kinase [Thecamonas trahens ATCC 50062]|eukprot:XP_013759101.1 CAMK/CAMK1 protein kinase [Thecamonas trahens ATCC 50062]
MSYGSSNSSGYGATNGSGYGATNGSGYGTTNGSGYGSGGYGGYGGGGGADGGFGSYGSSTGGGYGDYGSTAGHGGYGSGSTGAAGGGGGGLFGDTSQYEGSSYEYHAPGAGSSGMAGYGADSASSLPQVAPKQLAIAGMGEYTDLDPRDLDPFASLYPMGAGKVEFVNPDEAERGWGKKLLHQTAFAWVGGLALGTPWGAIEGLRQAPGSSTKLRMNSLLNGVNRRGPPMANTLAAVALMYNIVEASLNFTTPIDPTYNGILAGVASGLIYKSTAGAKRMLVGGIGGGLLAASFMLADFVAENGINISAVPDVLMGKLKALTNKTQQ